MSVLQRILLVEDDADIQTVVKLVLEIMGGFEVKVCASGEQAVRDAEAFAPDLILMDVMMPGMDGPDTLEALRAVPALSAVPVVFMTAKVQPDEIKHLKWLGARDVIAKPFDPMNLVNQIRQCWAG